MKLYEINGQILQLLSQIEPDPETGEVPLNEDELIEQINALVMQRDDILQYLAKVVLNLRSEQTAVKAEENRLRERRQRLQRKEERVMNQCDYLHSTLFWLQVHVRINKVTTEKERKSL